MYYMFSYEKLPVCPSPAPLHPHQHMSYAAGGSDGAGWLPEVQSRLWVPGLEVVQIVHSTAAISRRI